MCGAEDHQLGEGCTGCYLVVIIVISWLQAASKSMYRSDEISVIGYQVIGNKYHNLVYSVLKPNFNKNA